MFNWHKKEKPFLGYGGFGGASTGLAFGGAASSAVKATGGTAVEPGNGYVYHVFTSSGAIVATGPDVPNVDWLIVAGGGAGGTYYGGGGGNPSGTISDGAGGGGSGYIHPTLITDGRTIKRSEDQTNFPGGTGADGSFRIEIVSSTKTVTTTISGANTEYA